MQPLTFLDEITGVSDRRVDMSEIGVFGIRTELKPHNVFNCLSLTLRMCECVTDYGRADEFEPAGKCLRGRRL